MPKLVVLPIRGMAREGEMDEIPVDSMDSGNDETNSISIPDALVAFIDILGFGNKTDSEDMESTLFDFVAPLTMVAEKFPAVRMNVFSDCAFMAVSRDLVRDLISGLRFAFTQWTADGIMVRGGLARGSYHEMRPYAMARAPQNLAGNLFAGSGVTAAVQEGAGGEGALLFVTEEGAKILQANFSEPVYVSNGRYVLGWTDEDGASYFFAGISTIRLLRRLEARASENDAVVTKLRGNLLYACRATSNGLAYALIVAILASPIPTEAGRKKFLPLLGLKYPQDFDRLRDEIKAWLADPGRWKLLKMIAEMDSSIYAQLGSTMESNDHQEALTRMSNATKHVVPPDAAARRG